MPDKTASESEKQKLRNTQTDENGGGLTIQEIFSNSINKVVSGYLLLLPKLNILGLTLLGIGYRRSRALRNLYER